MSDSINQRVEKDTNDLVKYISKYLSSLNKKHYTFSQTMNEICIEYIQDHKLDKTNITEKQLRQTDSFLRSQGVDTNIEHSVRDDLKTIKYFLKKEKIVSEDTELTINDVIRMIVNKYIELYPKLEELRREDKFLLQRIAVEELIKKRDEKY